MFITVQPSLEHKQMRASPHLSDYYPFFDYLRILLALGVFASHADLLTAFPENFANACVQVFFALSGFLIGGILSRNTGQDLPRFYYNRITRIWVPYLIAVMVLAVGCVAKRQPITAKLMEFFFYKITFVYNLFGPPQLKEYAEQMPLQGTGNHFWSICVEEQFYLLAPLLLVLWPRGRSSVLILVWLINFVYPHNFAAISLGVLLALSQKNYGEWFAKWWAQIALLAVLGLAVALTQWNLLSYWEAVPTGAVCIVAICARRGKQQAIGNLLGGISYPFYLNHWVGLVLRKKASAYLGLSQLGGTMLALIIALAFSGALYYAVDRRILASRSKWYSPAMGWWSTGLAWSLAILGLLGGLAFSLWNTR